MEYGSLIELERTEEYEAWFWRLRDLRARDRINARLKRLEKGHAGDVRAVGDGVCELRIHYGPGYRIYYVQRGCEVIILLAGGDKSSQRDDIAQARKLARQL